MISLVPEAIYHPSSGMNPDSNGVSARTTECIIASNVDISSSETQSRPSTQLLGDFLSGFTVTGSTAWGGAFNGAYSFSSVSEGHPKFSKDLNLIMTCEWITDAWFFCVDGVPIYTVVSDAIYTPKTGWSPLPAYAGETEPTIAYTILQPNEPVIHFHSYVHPAKGSQLMAFCAEGIYRLDPVTGWSSCVDPAVPAFAVEQWSTTNFIDREAGATVVAAGSTYTRPSAAYLDAASRILLHYDTAGDGGNGLFVTTQMTSDILADEVEATLALPIAPAAKGGILTGEVTENDILPGTFYFVVENLGVIVHAGYEVHERELTGELYNRLIPVDDGQMNFGEDSWIELATGKYSISFVNDDFNGVDLIAYYTYKVAADYKPLYVVNYQNTLVMANTAEWWITAEGPPEVGEWRYFPWRVRWSDPLDFRATRQVDYQELAIADITPILALHSLETEASSTIIGPLYIYKHDSIIRGTYNQRFRLDPNLPVPLLEFELAFSEGVEAINTITQVNGTHFFLGRNDIYLFDGVRRISLTHDQEAGNTRIQQYLFDMLDLDSLQRCFGVYDEIRRKYILFIRAIGADAYPTVCFVYDLDLGHWTMGRYPETTAAISIDVLGSAIIDDLSGNIEDLEGTIDNLAGLRNKKVIFAMDGISYINSARTGLDKVGVSDTPFESYVITRDFFGKTLEEKDRVQKVYLEAIGGDLRISYNPYYEMGETFEQEDTIAYGSRYSRGSYHPDVVANNIRFKVDLDAATRLRWLQVFSRQQEFTAE